MGENETTSKKKKNPHTALKARIGANKNYGESGKIPLAGLGTFLKKKKKDYSLRVWGGYPMIPWKENALRLVEKDTFLCE